MIHNIEKQLCTGCKMCKDVCTENAISYIVDKKGFWYPSVDINMCSKCKRCIDLCPSLNDISVNTTYKGKTYSAWSKDDEVRLSSTSGGAFWVIAKKFIENGGVVVGARYKSSFREAEHIIVKCESELELIKGSKYFQSDTENIYREVKYELDSGKSVLFCGTPCHNIALKNFLGDAYNNVFYLDFICRSINSPKAFGAYIDELEDKYQSKATLVQLKNKKYGWQSLASRVVFENGKESILDKDEDLWVKGFVNNDLYTREACFSCKYKTLPRICSDITIGDFWGIKSQKPYELYKGISVVITNTPRGELLFKNASNDFYFEEHTIEEVIPGNPALLYNPKNQGKQDVFFDYLETEPFSVAVKKCIDERRNIKFRLRHFFREIKFFLKLIKNGKVSLSKYIYLNYFCKNIERKGDAKIIPYKGAILDLSNTAKINIRGKNLEIGGNKLKKSKAETYIRMEDGSVWDCNNGGYLFYNTTIEIKNNAIFDTGFFSANSGSVIIAQEKITLGEDVMIGRNAIIYDSDFHSILDDDYTIINSPQPVHIDNHVWLTSNVVVQKGVYIGKNCIVGANTVLTKNYPNNTIITGNGLGKSRPTSINWDRENVATKKSKK